MSDRKITPVTDNMDKANTYRVQKARLNAAIKGEFYLEALLIDYALLEDRLRSYMYHMGLLSNRYSLSIDTSARDSISAIVHDYKTSKESESVNLSNISDKMTILRCVLRWANTTTDDLDNNAYLKILKLQCESLDIELLLDTLKQIDTWKKYRNEIIHGLMNKNLDSLNSGLLDRVIEGKELAEALDCQLKILKRGNVIRKAINLGSK